MISQIHPMLNSSPNTSGSDPARSSSTGSTSSGFSSDIHRLIGGDDDDDGCDDKIIFSLQSPEPTKPPLPPKRGISSNPNLVANNPSWGSESLKLQNWDQSSREAQEKTPNSPSLHIFGSPIVRKGGKHEKLKGVMLDDEEDCNSDTGLSSLNSSSADDQFQLDTLV